MTCSNFGIININWIFNRSEDKMEEGIIFCGVETNNLKNIDVIIKKNALNLIIGPSGSGKSSLAYDTIAQIGLHEYFSMFNDDISEVTYKVSQYKNMTATVPIRQSNNNRNMKSTIGTYFGLNSKLATVFSVILGKPESFFVLNKDENVCDCCHGLGYVEKLDISKIINYNKPLKENPFKCWHRYSDFYIKIINKYCIEKGIDSSKTYEELTEKEKKLLLYGESEKKYQINYKQREGKNSRTTKFFGVLTEFPMRKNFVIPHSYYSYIICPECKGRKYSEEHLKHKINGISIGELMLMPFNDLEMFMKKLEKESTYEKVRILLKACLSFVKQANDLNLKYLSLNRTIPTLSGGELQRLRLVQVFCSQLTNLIIVLDEPVAGLSGLERDVVYRNIIKLTKNHTLVVVDHSDLFVENAKNIIALGNGGGKNGGNIINEKEYLAEQNMTLDIEKKPIAQTMHVKMKGNIYHYKGIDITLALNRMNVISGPSGIGKTTLIKEYLSRYFDRYTYISQKQILGNQNSNVASLLGISTTIYKYFADNFDKDKNFFSNISGKEGACGCCNGSGYIEYENGKLMCGECNGSGFNRKLSKYKINEKSILDVWNMTIDEALEYLKIVGKKVVNVLSSAQYLALGHLKIGQATLTLSGGENVRMRLLKLEGVNANVIGVDEPFKGLNPIEIQKVMKYLMNLCDNNKTIVVVDHTESIQGYFDRHICIELKCDEIVEREEGEKCY